MNTDDYRLRALEWATEQFKCEIESGFKLSSSFDSQRSKYFVDIMKRFPIDTLRVLAIALPKASIIPDQMLSAIEVLAFKTFKQVCEENLASACAAGEAIHFRGFELETKVLHRSLSLIGKRLCRQRASAVKGQCITAGANEWALVKLESGLRCCLSFYLTASCQLTYSISIKHHPKGLMIYAHEHFLGALGIGCSEWTFLDLEQYLDKMVAVQDFALWHMHECLRLCRGKEIFPSGKVTTRSAV